MVGRLNAILGSFEGRDHVQSSTAISGRVGLAKSTVHRLAEQLCSIGWLERGTGGYRVGLTMLDYGGAAMQRGGLREIALPHIYDLALKTGLAVQLAILDRSDVVFLERTSSEYFDLPVGVGGREPAYCTALGKALLAFEDAPTRMNAMAQMPTRTDSTVTEPRILQQQLERIRRSHIAYDKEEAYPGLACVASPIRGSGRAIGAISVTGPAWRIKAYAPLAVDVRNAATAIWEGRSVPPAVVARSVAGW